MIHEEICTYEVCKLAKEKGFPQHPDENGKCRIYTLDKSKNTYVLCDWTVWISAPWASEVIAAPTQSLLQRWLREERGVIVEVFVDDDSNMPLTYNIHQYKDWNWHCVCHHHGNYYAVNDWELCLEDALKYALENLV